MPEALRIVVGVSGGIAAYKVVSVVRQLVLLGHHVQVVPTESALRFVGVPTWEAISRNPVYSDLFSNVSEVRHVQIGQSADVILIAPATANTIARIAAGFADDLLGNVILASAAPLVIAPAMHTEMWANPATRDNIRVLSERGVRFVGPVSGQLTGDDFGSGRLAESEDIVAATLAAVRGKDLSGKKIVVSAGGTREALDPVRFLGNRSSGRQGIALASVADARGAEVLLVAAHLDVAPPAGIPVRRVSSASGLADVLAEVTPGADAVFMAAAVADYRPDAVSETKITKVEQGSGLSLRLVQNPDILATLSASREPGQVIIGFAAETEQDDEALLRRARAKIARKGSDYLVVNRVGWSTGFGTEDNTVMILSHTGDIVTRVSGSKRDVAEKILDLLI